MGWVFALALAALSFGALYASRGTTRAALEIAGAALLIGLAGYAWQGSPNMPGNPVANRTVP